MALQLLLSLAVKIGYALSVFTTKRRPETPGKLQRMTVLELRRRHRARTANLSYTLVSKSVLAVSRALDQLAFIIITPQTQILSSISSTEARGLDMLRLLLLQQHILE
jgi:hypothetical protein